MAIALSRMWSSSEAGIGLPRRDRYNGPYHPYVPDHLTGRTFVFPADVAADVSDAELAVARFDVRADALTDTEALARMLLRAESVASSHIEGLRISPQRLLRADADRAESGMPRDASAREVLANVDAMTHALETPSAAITVERLGEVHCRLLAPTRLAEHGGRVRSKQNWIGGGDYSPLGARFVPPPPELVPELLDDLCAFANGDSVSPLTQAALAHAQFETIHPYVDGNGRTGRALIYMVLRRRGLALRALPPISLILATRAESYVNALGRYAYVGAPDSPAAAEALAQWVETFAVATTRAVADAVRFEERVDQLVTRWRERLSGLRADSAGLALLANLTATPIVSARSVQAITGRSFAAANDAITALVDAGILRQTSTNRRNRTYEAHELIDEFAALERELASPNADTRSSPPVRPISPRPSRTTRRRVVPRLDGPP